MLALLAHNDSRHFGAALRIDIILEPAEDSTAAGVGLLPGFDWPEHAPLTFSIELLFNVGKAESF